MAMERALRNVVTQHAADDELARDQQPMDLRPPQLKAL
jgi:hypothetical protein